MTGSLQSGNLQSRATHFGSLLPKSCRAPSPINALFRIGRAGLDAFGFGDPTAGHNRQINDPVAPSHPVMLRRSIFGLIRNWNRLPADAVEAPSVKAFQRLLQKHA